MPLAVRILLLLMPKDRKTWAIVAVVALLPFGLLYVLISSVVSVIHVPAIEPSQISLYREAVEAVYEKTGVTLSWKELIALDAVRFNQDFSQASRSKAMRLADQFVGLVKVKKEDGTVETYYYKKSLNAVVQELIDAGELEEGALQRIKQYLLLPWETAESPDLPGEYVPVPGEEELVFPVVGQCYVSDGFRERINPVTGRVEVHSGIDLAAATGTPVVAAKAGRVVFADANGSAGNEVKIDHGDDTKTRYLHLDMILVERGQEVEAGQPIGRVGSTGRSTGPHLHFEYHVRGTPVDPAPYLIFK
ncbi:MAG: M23 family metallopeptidase [Brevibacillus sp.]|nr:M23 family metallopeptidase [Brevibacillus sp.]